MTPEQLEIIVAVIKQQNGGWTTPYVILTAASWVLGALILGVITRQQVKQLCGAVNELKTIITQTIVEVQDVSERTSYLEGWVDRRKTPGPTD